MGGERNKDKRVKPWLNESGKLEASNYAKIIKIITPSLFVVLSLTACDEIETFISPDEINPADPTVGITVPPITEPTVESTEQPPAYFDIEMIQQRSERDLVGLGVVVESFIPATSSNSLGESFLFAQGTLPKEGPSSRTGPFNILVSVDREDEVVIYVKGLAFDEDKPNEFEGFTSFIEEGEVFVNLEDKLIRINEETNDIEYRVNGSWEPLVFPQEIGDDIRDDLTAPGGLASLVLPTLTPEPTAEPTPTSEPTPEVRVSDITNEDRIWDADRGILGKRTIPFGLSQGEYNLSGHEEGYQQYTLSGILLEKPSFDEHFIVFKIGIPVGSEFITLNVARPLYTLTEEYVADIEDPNVTAGQYFSIHYIYNAYKTDKETLEFDLYDERNRWADEKLEVVLDLSEKAIGRQIAFSFEVGDTFEKTEEFFEDMVESLEKYPCEVLCEAHKQVLTELPTFYDTYLLALSGDNSSIDERTIYLPIGYSVSHIPVCFYDWCE